MSDTPPKAKPVSLRRKTHPIEGSVEENYEWWPHLSDGRIGLDPMTIATEVLTASGHPPRRTRDLVSAFNRTTGGDNYGLERIKRHGDIRHWCMACTGFNRAETRRCTTIHCPFWPYRMGKNPHNPKRGVNPFMASK